VRGRHGTNFMHDWTGDLRQGPALRPAPHQHSARAGMPQTGARAAGRAPGRWWPAASWPPAAAAPPSRRCGSAAPHSCAPPPLHQRAGKNGSDSLTGQSDPRSHPAHVYAPRVATVPRSSAGLQLWHAVRSTVMGVGRCELQDIKAALCVCCKAGVQAPRDPHLPRH